MDRALCGPGSPKLSDWARYLQGFREQELLDIRVHFDFAVAPSMARYVARLVFGARLDVPRSSVPPLELWRMYFGGLRPAQ